MRLAPSTWTREIRLVLWQCFRRSLLGVVRGKGAPQVPRLHAGTGRLRSHGTLHGRPGQAGQAGQAGMTKLRTAAGLGMGGDGWTEAKKS
jgi:hypothetical protein